jgi:hypothetical protein
MKAQVTITVVPNNYQKAFSRYQNENSSTRPDIRCAALGLAQNDNEVHRRSVGAVGT